MAAVHIIIKGKVQGVFFRVSTKKMADKTGVAGKVQNMDEGHVEIWASGNDEELQKFIMWCKQGPSGARVDEVIIEPVNQEYEEFVILRR